MSLAALVGVIRPRCLAVRLAGVAVVLVGCLSGLTARAEPQWSLKPTLILSGGLDDNLLFNNTGGDRVGAGGLRLDFKTFDRLWSVSLDAGASVYGFQQHQRIVPLGESTLHATVQIDRMNVFRATGRVRGSDDPLGLAQIGLLGAEGTVVGYRSTAELEHYYDERASLAALATFAGVGYLDAPFTDKSGEEVGAGAQGRYRLTRDLTLQGGVVERTFLSSGVAGTSLDVLPGVRYRLARRFFVEVNAGPTLFHDTHGFLPLPVATADVEFDTRYVGFVVTASQDLAVPSGRAGVLMTDLAEGTVRYYTNSWELRLRAGYYRSLSSPRSDQWIPGYGAQAEAYYRVAPFAWVGASALRFQRIGTVFQPPLVRDAVYAQILLTQGRP